jgi:hypothetical protein
VDAALWGFIGVVVGGIITGFISIRLETIRASKEAALDSAKRADDRRLGRDAFTRETLLALQDTLGVVTGQLVEYRTRLGGFPPAPDLVSRYQAASFRLFLLRSRVEDQDVRTATIAFMEQCGIVTDTKSEATADEALGYAAEAARDATERAGRLIRGTFETK